MSHPFITVIVPTYSRLSLLQETIACLACQTYPKDRFEVIVIDDGSTDGTREWLQNRQATPGELDLRPVSQANGGPAAARNRGINMARGEYIAFTDDDCLPEPAWLATLVAEMLRGGPYGGVGGMIIDHECIGPVARYCRFIEFDGYARDDKEYLPHLNTASMLCSTALLRELGGFDEAFRWPGGEDTDLGMRIMARGLRLRACPQAKLSHVHRTSVRALLRTMYFRGLGRGFLRMKYQGGRISVVPVLGVKAVLASALLLTAGMPAYTIWNLCAVRLPFGDAIVFALLHQATRITRSCGELVGRLMYAGQVRTTAPAYPKKESYEPLSRH